MDIEKLNIGDFEGEVTRIQRQLQEMGFKIQPEEIQQNFFGPSTKVALAEYIKRKGIKIGTGNIGEVLFPLPGGEEPRPGESLVTGASSVATVVTAAATENGNRAPNSGSPGVAGHVYMDYGTPADNIKLRLYSKGFGGKDALIASGETNEKGSYKLDYDPAKTISTGFELRVVDNEGKEHALSATLYNNDKTLSESDLNLIAPSLVKTNVESEFTRLAKDLTEVLGEFNKIKDAQEEGDKQDITLLSQATNWDARAIALASLAGKLSEATSLSHEASYALVRAGLPTETDQLAQVSAEEVDEVLEQTSELGVIDLNEDQRKAAVASFKDFANTLRLDTKDISSLSTYNEFLSNRGLSKDQQSAFASAYFTPRKSTAELWENVKAAGLPDNKIKELRLQGKLGYLTDNNVQLANNLQASIGTPENLSKLVDEGLYEPQAWDARLKSIAGTNDDNAEVLGNLIPPGYEGDTIADRKQAYTEAMADKVTAAFGEKVMRKKIETGKVMLGNDSVKTGVSNFLQKAEGLNYKLGVTHLDSFTKANHDVLFNGMTDEQRSETVKGMKLLQRIHQTTPNDEAMQVVLDLGYKYAQEIAELPQEYFVTRFERRYLELFKPLYPEKPGELARLVYNQSHQVTSTTYSFYTAVKHMQSTPPVFAISGSIDKRKEEQQKLSEKISGFPNLQQLFGSLDFCECQHCRSVLSPAAYLVDLLQFLDRNETHWQYFLDKWKADHGGEEYTAKYSKPYDALIARRPDIVNLPLTCENTNTALPYIDVVNEILEYYLVNKNLEKLAYDTGNTTTPELLAEPQNIEPAAYGILKQAKYPFKLPFDLSIETVRQFCNQCDVPFWKVIETLQPVAGQDFEIRKKITAELLGISPAEYAIFTNENSLPSLPELYGYADDIAMTADLKSAKKLANRLGVTYKELVWLVKMRFINPAFDALILLQKMSVTVMDVFRYKKAAGFEPFTNDEQTVFEEKLSQIKDAFGTDAKAKIENDWNQNIFHQVLLLNDTNAACNFDATKVGYADKDALKFDWLRFNLFVRLWRKLGWSMEEVDRVLNVFIPGELLSIVYDPAKAEADRAKALAQGFVSALVNIAHLQNLNAQVKTGKQAIIKLTTIWSEIPVTGKNPLYQQLFLSRTTARVDKVFDDALGQYLTKDVLMKESQKDHTLSLQAGLGLTSAEIEQILKHEGMDIATVKLTLSNVSLLYKYSLLAKGLKISVQELIFLKELSGLNPFTSLSTKAMTKNEDDIVLNQTLQFVELAIKIKGSNFKIADINYLFRHSFDPKGAYRSVSDSANAAIKTLSIEISRVLSEHSIPGNPARPDDLSPFTTFTDELVQQKLSLIVPPEMTQAFFAMWTGRQDKNWNLLKDNFKEFLTEETFNLLFEPDEADADDKTKQENLLKKRSILANAVLPFIQQKLIRESVGQVLANAISADLTRIDWLIDNSKYVHDAAQPDVALSRVFAGANNPMNANNVSRAFILIDKVHRLAEGFKLSDRELQHLITNAKDFDDLDLGKIPLTENGPLPNAQALFKTFTRVCDYTSLRQSIAGDGPELIDLFIKARLSYEINADETATKALHLKGLYEQIANLTRREINTIEEIATKLGMNAVAKIEDGKLQINADSFANERDVQKLWSGLQLVYAFGIPLQSLIDSIDIVSSGQAEEKYQSIAQNLKNALKAKYEPETWQQIAQPIYDKLRQHKRDALVAYLLHTNRDLFDSMEEMYEYFLVDPGTEPVVQTSRIRLATASIQLFIQRCLLNLENRWNKKVPPGAINSKHWMWMNRYRVWEANRKIFLWPENWLEPEWRDDKTNFFKELEGKLLQSDVSTDVVEDCFFGYLKGLEKIARLEIVAMYCEEDPVTPEANKLHVIGRSYGMPHSYFYRSYAQQMWTPWEPIDAEIDGDHIVTVMWRGRLHIFWVTFLEKVPPENKPAPPSDTTTTLSNWKVNNAIDAVTSGTNKKTIEAYLHWTEYFQGQWSTKQTGSLGTPIQFDAGIGTYATDIAVYVTKERKNTIDDTLDGAVRINLIDTKSKTKKAFRVVNKNSVPEIVTADVDTLPAWPFQKPFKINRVAGDAGAMTVKFEHYIKTLNGQPQSNSDPQTILEKTVGNFNLVPCSQPVTMGGQELGQLVTPFFYQDSWHTFYIEPTLTETITIDEWDEWVSAPPVPEKKPKHGGIKIDPIHPWPKKLPLPQPGDPGWLDFDDPRIMYKPKLREDWVTRPGTYVQFGERVIGKEKAMNLVVLNDAGAGRIIKDRNQLNTVINSSTVADNVALVASTVSDKTVGVDIASSNAINVNSDPAIALVGTGGIAISTAVKAQPAHFGGAFGNTHALGGNLKALNKLKGGFQ